MPLTNFGMDTSSKWQTYPTMTVKEFIPCPDLDTTARSKKETKDDMLQPGS